MIATIGKARIRATTYISTAHPPDISSSSSSSSTHEYRATLEQAIVMTGAGGEGCGGLVEALRVGQNACDF